MAFQDVVTAAQGYFPQIQVKYKDQSTFMKILGTILFFNKAFMNNYITTIGNTVYFPTQSFVNANQNSASIIFMHECVHIYDSNRLGSFLFKFLYLLPQCLALLAIPLLFVSWKIALPFLLFAAPLPAYFRMIFERRAYIAALYALNALGKKLNFVPQLSNQAQFYEQQFPNSYYYFMWPFGVSDSFNQAVALVQNGQRPYQDPVFDMLDNLITKV